MASKGKAKAAAAPLRATLASLGMGLVWAAMHTPENMNVQADVLAWVFQGLAAAFVARTIIEVSGALLLGVSRTLATLLGRRRSG